MTHIPNEITTCDVQSFADVKVSYGLEHQLYHRSFVEPKDLQRTVGEAWKSFKATRWGFDPQRRAGVL